jgi:hypothetical protein
MKFNCQPKPVKNLRRLSLIFLLLLSCTAYSQTIMFDDFTYSSPDDAQIGAFNKWEIITGVSGPPEGGVYNKSNIAFITDPANANNKLMTLSTTVNGATKATTHARIETSGFEYFEGTYAARVYLSDNPFTYKDANIQTFYTIVGSDLAGDGSRYSELDIIEYMAADKWGISPDNRVAYYTSWNKYQNEPEWAAWKTYFAVQGSIAGWHTFIAQCTDGVNVKYWIDDTYLGAQSKCDGANPDNDTTSPVYPRSNMQVAFANWIWNNVTGTSGTSRTTTMQADWVLYYKNTALTKAQIDALVAGYKTQGLQRRNLAGQTFVSGGCTVPAQPGTITGNSSVPSGSSQTYSVAAVSGATSYSWTLPSGWTGSSNTSSITTTTGSAGGTISVTANNSCGASASRTLAVTVTTCSVPAQPGTISGNTTVTSGSSQSYSITAVSGATSYTWTLPSGWSGSSTSTSINTTAGSTGGTISVKANNACGSGTARTLTVTVGSTASNLALNKAVTVSSVEAAGLEGNKAVDGNAATRWASVYTDPQWIYVDLGATYDINRVKITWEAAYATAYQVQVSANASAWTSIKTVTGNTALTNDWTGLSGSGRYLRINGTARGTAYGYSIWELEVYGTPVSCTLPAQPGTIAGNATVASGSSQTYSIGAVSGATSYTWTLPAGWSGSSASTSIATTAGTASGTISVKANNACGSGAVRTLNVTVTGGGTTTRIEAENYLYMAGVIKETCSEGGQNLGSFDANDWTSYNINIATAGTYTVSFRVSSIYAGKTLRFEKDNGSTLLATITVPNTGNWQTWTTVSATATMPAGAYAVGLTTYTGGLNINWFEITGPTGARLASKQQFNVKANMTKIVNPVKSMKALSFYPNPMKNNVNIGDEIDQPTKLQIVDYKGKVVMDKTLRKGEKEINVSDLMPGTYIIKLSNSKFSKTERVIKE